MPLTHPRPAQPSRSIGSEHSALTKRLIADGCKPQPVEVGGRLGLALGALRDIANDMPGVRAVHKRTAMRNRADQAISVILGLLESREAAE